MGIGEHLFGRAAHRRQDRAHSQSDGSGVRTKPGHPHSPSSGAHAADASAPGAMGRPSLYHVLTAVGFLGRRRVIYDRIAHLAALRPGQRALDVGCGTGALTEALHRRVGPTGSVLGVDPSEEMVTFARRTAPAGVEYAVGLAERLGLPDSSVDAVASSLAVHHIAADQRATAAREAARVLRPGGRLVLVDVQSPTERIGRCLVRLGTSPAMVEGSTEQLASLVRDAGMTVVESGRIGPVLAYCVATAP